YCCATGWDAACAAQAISICPASPKPELIGTTGGTPGTPAVPGSCDGVPTWSAASASTYVAGTIVKDGTAKYQCKAWPYSGYCVSSGYQPTGIYGADAWTKLADCTTGTPAIPATPGTPTYCAINRVLPPVPSWQKEPCQSGLDCQVNQSCTQVATAAACGHDKCVAGGPLAAACDPCVERVCAANSACCGTNWTSACVGLVKSVCDADCGTPAVACSHGFCTAGAALDDECDGCVNSVCGTPGFEYCCTSGWDASCVEHAKRSCGRTVTTTTPGTGGNICDYALAGTGTFSMKGATVRGGDAGGGIGSFMITADGVGSVLEGNAVSGGTGSVWSSSVSGTAKAGAAIAYCNSVAGGCQSNTSVPSLSLPTKTFTCGTTAEAIVAGDTRTLAPGTTYGPTTVGANGTLVLQAGTYRLASLRLEAGAKLVLPTTGTTYLDLCGDLILIGGNDITGIGTGAAAEVFRFQVYGNGQFTVLPPANLVGVYKFPNKQAIPSLPGEVADADYSAFFKKGTSVTNRVYLRGLLWSAVTTLGAYSRIDAGGLTGTACLDAYLDQPIPAVCPTPTGPPGRGQCVANAVGYSDPALAAGTVDLAVDMACRDEVTVCNHGKATAPAGVQVGMYSRYGQQFATDAPDENFRIGTCTVPTSIAPGQCVTTSCDSAAMSVDAFLFANPSGAVTEFSRLDNWSMRDESAACGGSTPTTVYYEYIGECPNNSAPAWGLLIWDTTTPGTSRATFSARLADSSAALAGGFTEVGVASASLGTEDCDQFDSCRVDLTQKLGLGRRQPTHLELEVKLEPGATGTAAVDLWDITYTCIVDQ
ncbi:MAG TPA: hypothetical protein VLC09_11510, partial [Polyangiaceae bacterium]|nr:hypothetical protein [Polyangiaceae bacterium]